MTARSLGTEVSCDGPDSARACPESAAVRARFTSMTAAAVRRDGRRDGWVCRRRDGRLVDLCPACKTTP
ncbi:hypothetical protein [Streptomyces luteocolor]|uniref:hypothetical protein n=1 Tax=Streptomyces luteocolor TaxID=285500 RepID=UPI0008539A2D|nr:hypothetical protein [Streptomyces luteocolor]